MADDPEIEILSNACALHSLKRAQLTRLCKRFNLKANGKNVELIQRLEQLGKDLHPTSTETPTAAPSDQSWDLVSCPSTSVLLERDQNLEEFGRLPRDRSWLPKSTSNSSIASTIRSCRTAVARKLNPSSIDDSPVDTLGQNDAADDSVYPSLAEAFEKFPLPPARFDPDATLESFDHSIEGAIRRVTTHTTVDSSMRHDLDGDDETTSNVEDKEERQHSERDAVLPPTAVLENAPFVFGSSLSAAPEKASFNFAMPATTTTKMPGAFLSLSTTSSASESAPQPSETEPPPQAEALTQPASRPRPRFSIIEEMNQRARQSRLEAERLGIKLGSGGAKKRKSCADGDEDEGERAKMGKVFEGKHRKVFDQMDSITNHYAAKRSVVRSTSSASKSSLFRNKDTSDPSSAKERPMKRLKSVSPPATKPILTSSSIASKKPTVVSALRESGWTASSSERPPTSQDQMDKEQRENKRRFELAKARRKSGSSAAGSTPFRSRAAATGGTKIAPRRRSLSKPPFCPFRMGAEDCTFPAKPSGPVATPSVGSSFLKTTLKRFTSSTNPGKKSATSASALPSSSSMPRFATPTASSNSRSARIAPSTSTSSLASKQKSVPVKPSEPGWKRFNLQESLKRPMTWTTSSKPLATSNAVTGTPATPKCPLSSTPGLSRTVSTGSLGVYPRLPLPPSKSSLSSQFGADVSPAPPPPSIGNVSPFSNLSNTVSATATTGSLPSKKGSIRAGANRQDKKLVSSSTKRARDNGKPGIEGLETKARKLRAIKDKKLRPVVQNSALAQ
ncbi:hypothetical protein JCM3766R1_003958 [Sporobolomyces carnicolor]